MAICEKLARVLVIEDQEVQALRYSRELQHHGFDVVIAHDVESAKSVATEQKFDAALCNLGIPIDRESDDPRKVVESPINGLNLCNWLDRQLGMPVFVITGTSSDDVLRRCAFPVISKPVEDFEAEVVALLKDALGR